MLIKSLLRMSAALTRMLYISESSEFSRVNLLNMESLNMTSISVISSRKTILGCREDSAQFTAQQNLVPYLPS
jgi:hypothetical protein